MERLRYIKKKMDELHPYENNPRINDGAVDDVAESITQCGYIAPIVIDENGVILAGHTRYKALKKLGFKEVDVVMAADLTEEQKRKYRLYDNKTGEAACNDGEDRGADLDSMAKRGGKELKVFIAGKVTGTTDYIERFERMEKELSKLGLEVVNPVKETRHLGVNAPWVEYMKITIPLLCNCDAIYLMNGWTDSNGATLEKYVADGLGLLLMLEPTSRERIRNS